jgi:hypothetical protein
VQIVVADGKRNSFISCDRWSLASRMSHHERPATTRLLSSRLDKERDKARESPASASEAKGLLQRTRFELVPHPDVPAWEGCVLTTTLTLCSASRKSRLDQTPTAKTTPSRTLAPTVLVARGGACQTAGIVALTGSRRGPASSVPLEVPHDRVAAFVHTAQVPGLAVSGEARKVTVRTTETA